MQNDSILSPFSQWADEFSATLMKNNSLCIAIFSTDKELLYANESMSALFKVEPCNSLINPTFDKLLLMNNSTPLIFEGFLTLGDYSSVNTSIWAQVYRKKNNLLVLGGVNAAQLLEQNEIMHQLNREISTLQRELIREKHSLENTLKQLNLANNELKELNTSKDRFISILAHDLKNPFNAILGFLSLLSSNIRTYSIDTIESQINIVNTSAQNAYKLLEDILTWARAQSDKTPFNPEKLDLATICSNVIERMELSAKNKNITINDYVLNNIFIFADKEMVNTILRNLLTNALKFTNKGGAVNLYAEQNQLTATITVSDNGIGIEPEVVTKLFDISHKITTEGTAHEKGTGLGLLLCKEFIEKHGGDIWVESELGKGSDFKFTLPLSKK